MSKDKLIPTQTLSLKDEVTEFLLYTAPSGQVKVEVLLNNEILWLTQERMAQLFGVQRPAISKHLKNIFDSGELQQQVVCSILEHTTEHATQAQKIESLKSHKKGLIQQLFPSTEDTE